MKIKESTRRPSGPASLVSNMKSGSLKFKETGSRRPSGAPSPTNPEFKGLQQRRGSNASLAFSSFATRQRSQTERKVADYFEHANGWQMKSERVLERISCLFNCGTMSDVIFQVEGFEIPAHKMVLGASSPVFYSRFFETGRGKDLPQSRRHARHFFGGMQKHGRTLIQIEDVPAAAFFEFLRFLYTDKLSVTLDNVSSLMILADDFKVAGLTEVCMEYLSAMTSDPLAVLCILKILRNSFLKCIVCLWRDITESHREMRAEAQYHSNPIHEKDLYSSEASTRAPSSIGSAIASGLGQLVPISAKINSHTSRSHTPNTSGDFISTSATQTRSSPVSFELSKQSRQMSYKLGQVVQELEVLCWRCVDKETEKVLASDAFREQDLNVLRAILARHCSAVPEIALFRAVNQWATHQCMKKGLAPTPENRRKLLGKEATQLLRFPAMTTEQLQREVVPTGLLEYADVHSLLRYKDGCAQLVRFSAQQREGFEEADLPTARRPSLEPLRPQRAIYEAVSDDPVDALLAAGLLRQHLRGGVSCVPGVERKDVKSPLLRGCDAYWMDPKKGDDTQVAPKAEDFERLGPGLYRFKKGNILRMRIENGEVMVYDTETTEHVEDGSAIDKEIDNEANNASCSMPMARLNSKTQAKYRIPSKVRRTLGIPLVSFLEGELV